jgi:hypothetical protein
MQQREVWLSEFGADCFDVSNVDRTEIDRTYAAGRWFPLYLNDVCIGHVKIDNDGYTSVTIRALKGNHLEVRPDPECTAMWEKLQKLKWDSDEMRQAEEELDLLDTKIQVHYENQ